MEKQEFMRKLKVNLWWYLSREELHRVIQEYDGYFPTAVSSGRADMDVAELGDPALVAAEILSEYSIDMVHLRYEKARLTLAFILLAFSGATLLFYPTWYWNWSYTTCSNRFLMGTIILYAVFGYLVAAAIATVILLHRRRVRP